MINDALTEFDNNRMKVWKYVDDLTIGENRAIDDVTEVQQCLESLHEWSVSNKLKLNPSKCQAMSVYFGKNNPPDVDLRISEHSLAVVQKVKLLGVIIQNDLKWQGQVDNMHSKANGKMFMLRKLKEAGLNAGEILSVYKGYMRPVLEYAAPLWHAGLAQSQEDRLERIQKRVCKLLLGKEYKSYSDSRATLDLEPLHSRRLQICKEFASKAHASEKFSRWFPATDYSSSMTLRKPPKVKSYRWKTKRFKESPVPYMAELLNHA
ncbi:uncharacterized protein [Amphiura filiformis]|uniref:uncharacterized protein n=1 Tax=Amphiura filiformis TaxID=82378 RepID=UPI003B21E811